jgi:hypothetical protein
VAARVHKAPNFLLSSIVAECGEGWISAPSPPALGDLRTSDTYAGLVLGSGHSANFIGRPLWAESYYLDAKGGELPVMLRHRIRRCLQKPPFVDFTEATEARRERPVAQTRQQHLIRDADILGSANNRHRAKPIRS